MPSAAVIPAQLAYSSVVAVKTPVVEVGVATSSRLVLRGGSQLFLHVARCGTLLRCRVRARSLTVNNSSCSKQASRLQVTARDNRRCLG